MPTPIDSYDYLSFLAVSTDYSGSRWISRDCTAARPNLNETQSDYRSDKFNLESPNPCEALRRAGKRDGSKLEQPMCQKNNMANLQKHNEDDSVKCYSSVADELCRKFLA